MKNARILFWDIEATNLSADMGYVLCIGYMWQGENKAHVIRIDETPEYKKCHTNDKGVLREFEKVIEQADIVVHHFGEFFDIPFVQTRRLLNGMKPMVGVSQVDTWRIAKKRLKLHSNRLASLIDGLECPIKKTPVSGKMWVKASAGDSRALNYVVDHCEKDVESLAWVYDKIKAFWDQHPTTSISEDLRFCRLCKANTGEGKGLRPARKQVYQRMVCTKCGLNWQGKVVK